MGGMTYKGMTGEDLPSPVPEPTEALKALVQQWEQSRMTYLDLAKEKAGRALFAQADAMEARADECRLHAEALSAALSTPSAGWQAIETAKQDGCAIIGLTWNGEVMPVYWHRGSEMSQPGWRHAGDGWRSGNAPRIVKWHQWPAPPAGPAPEKE